MTEPQPSEDRPWGRGVIYTAITGGKDELRAPGHVLPGVRYVCFTDDLSLRSDIWELRALERTDKDPTRVARRAKILPHRFLPGFDWSLWIDANFDVIGDLRPFLEANLPLAPFQAFQHAERDCAYREMDACVEHKKECPTILAAQAQRYRGLGMPDGRPVVLTGVLLRRHNDPSVVGAMESWWSEICSHSRRDQVSLPFVLWKQPTHFRFFLDDRTIGIEDALPLRRRLHQIEASFPCWRKADFPRSLVEFVRCWRCRGERPPIRGWN